MPEREREVGNRTKVLIGLEKVSLYAHAVINNCSVPF